jgi:hypothetical protein
LIIEVGLAAKHPPFDSFIGIWGSVIADSLVAIGVFGELLFSAMGSKRLGELQRRSKLMVAELNTQAREANARAAEADRARAELEVKLQPRSLNQEQWDLIQGLRGKLPSVNIASETDAETCWFAGQIRDAFFSAGVSVGMYRRAADVHSFGTLIYEPKGFDGARPRTVEPLVDIFRKSDGSLIAFSLAIITGIPSDIQAPDDIPLIVVGGRFILPPSYMVFPWSAVKADPTNASSKPQNTSANRESSI